MSQLWKIKGQVYTLAQLRELKRQGLDPRHDEIVMKFITPRKEKVQQEKVVEIEKKEDNVVETDKEEFARLKNNKAWLHQDTKARYAELKAKFNN